MFKQLQSNYHAGFNSVLLFFLVKETHLPMWSVTRLAAEVQTSARARPPTKKLFLIIPSHMMNREIIPGRKKRIRRCPL